MKRAFWHLLSGVLFVLVVIGACDTLTATLDTVTHLTIVKGYHGICPLIPFCGREGNYHCLEMPLYYRSLRENIAQRIENLQK